MRFALPGFNGPCVLITDEALAIIERFRQLGHRDGEAGGQLFAQFDGADTIICEATPPRWLDRRTRYGFLPNRWLERREIHKRYARGLHFVGDWHTHPQPIPHPSRDDVRSMTECYRQSLHDLRAFILIIVGTDPTPKGLYVALVGASAVRLRYSSISGAAPPPGNC